VNSQGPSIIHFDSDHGRRTALFILYVRPLLNEGITPAIELESGHLFAVKGLPSYGMALQTLCREMGIHCTVNDYRGAGKHTFQNFE